MIPLAKPYFDSLEIEEIKKVLESGWVSQGPKVKEFEENVAKFVGVKYAIAVSNCTAALHLANLSIGIKKGDEVLVADYTFPATGHSVLYCGAKPIFVDVDPKTFNINPKNIEEKINNKTKAIIPVHTFGQPADMDPILKIAKKYNLHVIEDAACALGAKYKNKFTGTFGDIGCYSFHARKGITTGEGGMVVTNDKNLAENIRHLSVFGMKSAWDREKSQEFFLPTFTDAGYNYKMSDILAAIGIIQLGKIDKIIKRKRELAHYWNQQLERIDCLDIPYESPDSYHIYQSYVTLVDKKISRNQLIGKLLNKKIQTQIGTYASHIQPVYNYKKSCPISFDIFSRSLALPLFYNLTNDDIDFAVKTIKKEIGDIK
jgi:dTDP-4-amino-4,6-dideoxygalactose transaminase